MENEETEAISMTMSEGFIQSGVELKYVCCVLRTAEDNIL